MAKKVVRMLKGALYAHTKDYKIEVQYAEDEEAENEEVSMLVAVTLEDTLLPATAEVTRCGVSHHTHCFLPSRSKERIWPLCQKHLLTLPPIAFR